MELSDHLMLGGILFLPSGFTVLFWFILFGGEKRVLLPMFPKVVILLFLISSQVTLVCIVCVCVYMCVYSEFVLSKL
jgi:hypothetical protein